MAHEIYEKYVEFIEGLHDSGDALDAAYDHGIWLSELLDAAASEGFETDYLDGEQASMRGQAIPCRMLSPEESDSSAFDAMEDYETYGEGFRANVAPSFVVYFDTLADGAKTVWANVACDPEIQGDGCLIWTREGGVPAHSIADVLSTFAWYTETESNESTLPSLGWTLAL